MSLLTIEILPFSNKNPKIIADTNPREFPIPDIMWPNLNDSCSSSMSLLIHKTKKS